MLLNGIGQFIYDLLALFIRLIRRKILIFSGLIVFILFYLIYFLFNDFHYFKNNQEQASLNTFADDIEEHVQGFVSLKRQHKLNPKDDLIVKQEFISKINQLSNSINNNNNNNQKENSFLIENNQNGIKCRNSVQGKLIIVDDRGNICDRINVAINGCCIDKHPGTRRYVCDTCQENQCCQIYEHCVSCCMLPTNRDNLNKLFMDRKSEHMKIFLLSISDPFELCLLKCRTSSVSVLHENTYKNSNLKYCFGLKNE